MRQTSHQQKKGLRLLESLLILLLISTFVSGCIGIEQTVEAPTSLIPADATGEQLYNMPILGTQVGCVTCHALDDTTVLGPSLKDIGSSAQGRVPGMSAEEYIRQSILEPNAFIMEGSTPNLMPPHYVDALTEMQIDALVTYLMSQ